MFHMLKDKRLDIVARVVAHSNNLGLVWETQNRRGLEGLKSPSYSILNKEILASPIPSSI
jgi:hypothetical protein